MRCIFVGIEYAGKSTLVNLLTNYYQHRKLRVHVDDHFTIRIQRSVRNQELRI